LLVSVPSTNHPLLQSVRSTSSRKGDAFVTIVVNLVWGTGIRGLIRGIANLPKVTRSY